MVKTLLQVFEDDEFKKLVKVKKGLGLNWHDFILKKCLGGEKKL